MGKHRNVARLTGLLRRILLYCLGTILLGHPLFPLRVLGFLHYQQRLLGENVRFFILLLHEVDRVGEPIILNDLANLAIWEL